MAASTGPDDAADRSWAVPVAGVLAVVAGVAVVGVLLVGGSTDTCACSPPRADADASVDADRNESRVTVTYTADRVAGYLLVRTDSSNGSVTVAGTDGNAVETADGVRLAGVGDAVTFAPAVPGTDTPVEITVVAHPPEGSEARPNVVVDETVRL